MRHFVDVVLVAYARLRHDGHSKRMTAMRRRNMSETQAVSVHRDTGAKVFGGRVVWRTLLRESCHRRSQ